MYDSQSDKALTPSSAKHCVPQDGAIVRQCCVHQDDFRRRTRDRHRPASERSYFNTSGVPSSRPVGQATALERVDVVLLRGDQASDKVVR